MEGKIMKMTEYELKLYRRRRTEYIKEIKKQYRHVAGSIIFWKLSKIKERYLLNLKLQRIVEMKTYLYLLINLMKDLEGFGWYFNKYLFNIYFEYQEKYFILRDGKIK